MRGISGPPVKSRSRSARPVPPAPPPFGPCRHCALFDPRERFECRAEIPRAHPRQVGEQRVSPLSATRSPRSHRPKTRHGPRREDRLRESVRGQLKLYTGTSGYGFREWTGAFYPEGTRPRDFLAFYSSFSTASRSTTRSGGSPGRISPPRGRPTPRSGFRFAIKAHQGITHRARLRDTADDVAAFRAALAPLGGRLGPILFQCPPWLRRDDDLLGNFLDGAARDRGTRARISPRIVAVRRGRGHLPGAWRVARRRDLRARRAAAGSGDR